jgi:hypothetical protein
VRQPKQRSGNGGKRAPARIVVSFARFHSLSPSRRRIAQRAAAPRALGHAGSAMARQVAAFVKRDKEARFTPTALCLPTS